MFSQLKLSFVFLTIFLALTGSAQAALMTKDSMALGWNGYPTVRYWINSKMAVEPGVNLDLNSTSQAGVKLANTLFLSGRVLMVFKEMKDFNINVGGGLNITTISNFGNVDGCGYTGFNIYGLVDTEYFIKSLPNISFGASIGFGLNTFTVTLAGTSTTTTDVGFVCNGFALNTLSIRYYFK